VTEQEWLASENPLQLLDFVGAPLEARKSFLLTAACFHRHWARLPVAAQEWARLAEPAAEGKASRQDLDDAFEGLEEALNELGPPGEFVALLDLAYGMWKSEWPYLEEGDQDPAWCAERKAQAALVHDVFANPFRPITLSPAWCSETVLLLARTAYAGAFDALPVLADALEEAGCTSGDVLAHCRRPGLHVRGCWVVDLLLGQE
jgi:hypothetical protein